MDKICIVSLNTRGLSNDAKRKEVFHFLKQNECDIACLQECHSEDENEEIWSKGWGGLNFWSHGNSQARGVAILIHPQARNLKVLDCCKDKEGRWIMIKTQNENKEMLIVNIYGPNDDNPEFFRNIAEAIVKMQCPEVILIGDYNLVMNPLLDRKNGKRYKPNS